MNVTFDGGTYSERLDRVRLLSQLDYVRDFLLQHGWVTLYLISQELEYPESSVSARIRDLRKEKFGGFKVVRRRKSEGTFEYKIELPEYKQATLF
jgi:hypothetical protein